MTAKRMLFLFVFALLFLSVPMAAAQSPANYRIQRFVLVGGGASGSASYAVTSVIGQPATDVADSATYTVRGGFLHPHQLGLFSVGGEVQGLAGNGLVLQNNGGDDLPIGKNGPFAFATKQADGSAYAVSVKTQPANPAQTCTIGAGTGKVAGADVTNVTVTCNTDAQPSLYLPKIQG